ncbi:unnamed protein product [Penicillium egyptiacum]|uniref:Uncharacterized protein n=1 Tax=Penicillium egyptiacum TaxID=1303716 RepID=A0A9W4KBG0_9EURO|nr:unnamed protein product [Penicillium egyptiacum]
MTPKELPRIPIQIPTQIPIPCPIQVPTQIPTQITTQITTQIRKYPPKVFRLTLNSPRAWLFGLLQAAAALLVHPTTDEEASAKKIDQMRVQVEVLEQQLRSTEARVRDSEIFREIEKKHHKEKVRHLDAQLTTLSRGIKESLVAKDRVLGECRGWRRKFEDLEDLQRQAQENPVRGKGRSRWAPTKIYGVGKGERGRSDKKFTAIAQVAIVNAAWESKLVRLESEARDYVARTADQFRSLHDAATALSNENAHLRQQIQASPDVPHKLAQQQVRDAVRSTMEFADQQHEECVNLLKQTYQKELMAAKADYEGKLAKATAAFKTEAETALAQQRKAAGGAAQEKNSLEDDLAAKEAQLGKLRTANAKVTAELQAEKEAHQKLDGEMQAETKDYVECVQQRDGYFRAGKRLQDRYNKLQVQHAELECMAAHLAREKEELEKEVEDLKEAVYDLADEGESLYQKVEKMEDNNRALLDHNAELFCESVVSGIELQQTWGKVGNLERQVADFQTAEAADITEAVNSMQVGGSNSS